MIEPTIKADGAKIKGLRVAKRWGQQELAKAAGYSKRTIEKAEAGGRIQADILECIAEALGVTIADITDSAAGGLPVLPAPNSEREQLRRATAGRWYAVGYQERGPSDKPLAFAFEVVLELDGDVLTGHFSVTYDTLDVLPDWTFVISADYRMDRFLLVDCRTDNPARLQFSTWILKLNAECDVLYGRYVGYGARTGDIVFGELTLRKKHAELITAPDPRLKNGGGM